MSACSYDSMLIPNWSTGYLDLLLTFENAALNENYRLLVDSVLEVGVSYAVEQRYVCGTQGG